MLREIRAVFRLARVGVHLAWGALTVAVAYPWLDEHPRRALKQRWSRQLLEMLGVRLQLGAGRTALPPALMVCNHISWLDIFVINALTPAAFVSKDDVRHWPLIGWLCAHTETIFLERGSRAAAQRARATMADHLRAGIHVAAFPEGTTTRGDHVRSFHAALFQSAIDAATPVIPLVLDYTGRHGDSSSAPAYVDDITLPQSLWAIACADALTARVRVLSPVAVGAADRRALAARCQRMIARHLGRRGSIPRQEEDAAPPPARGGIRGRRRLAGDPSPTSSSCTSPASVLLPPMFR